MAQEVDLKPILDAIETAVDATYRLPDTDEAGKAIRDADRRVLIAMQDTLRLLTSEGRTFCENFLFLGEPEPDAQV